MRFVRAPLALVHVATPVDQPPVEIRRVISPVAFIEAAIGPDLAPTAFPDLGARAPLARIGRPVREPVRLPSLQQRQIHRLLLKLRLEIEWT